MHIKTNYLLEKTDFLIAILFMQFIWVFFEALLGYDVCYQLYIEHPRIGFLIFFSQQENIHPLMLVKIVLLEQCQSVMSDFNMNVSQV